MKSNLEPPLLTNHHSSQCLALSFPKSSLCDCNLRHSFSSNVITKKLMLQWMFLISTFTSIMLHICTICCYFSSQTNTMHCLGYVSQHMIFHINLGEMLFFTGSLYEVHCSNQIHIKFARFKHAMKSYEIIALLW